MTVIRSRDSDGINKALNYVRGLKNPPGLTGRSAVMRYAAQYAGDPAAEEAFIRGLLGIPQSVAVVIVHAGDDVDEVDAPVPPPAPPADPYRAQRLANLEKAKAAKAEKAQRKADIAEQRLKNLKKARRKLKRMRGA